MCGGQCTVQSVLCVVCSVQCDVLRRVCSGGSVQFLSGHDFSVYDLICAATVARLGTACSVMLGNALRCSGR